MNTSTTETPIVDLSVKITPSILLKPAGWRQPVR